jgi:NADH:ubiquinone oxidoreductase subunit 6 (subunit J)
VTRERDVLAVIAISALFVVMAMSFVGIPWPTEPHEIPIVDRDPNATAQDGVANSLFLAFPVTIVLIAVLLAAAMIGGVYLAKMDEAGKVGP